MTLRQVFELTPPLRHSPKAEESELVAHIMDRLGCTLEEAVRSLNSMRHPNSRVLVYNAADKVWTGSKWTPNMGTEDMLRELVASHRVTVRNMDAAKRAIRRLEKQVGRLQRRVRELRKTDPGEDAEDAEEPEPETTPHRCVRCGSQAGQQDGNQITCMVCGTQFTVD